MGGAHSELARVRKSLPSYLINTNKGKKQISKAIKLLTNLDFLLSKPSTGEMHISLNPRKRKEIYEFVEENERREYMD